ncbi:hypothetical protein SNEBB_004197 [Seison nebaliae]|nr:hypothetical protein SNEBB_004197 [Seison nebaliae]
MLTMRRTISQWEKDEVLIEKVIRKMKEFKIEPTDMRKETQSHRRCFACNREGHMAKEGWKTKKEKQNFRWHRCNEEGHLARNCLIIKEDLYH